MSSRYFPSELLFDILIKLPVKALIRFQCLSKSIQAMITDPTFISMHRNRCTAHNNGGDDGGEGGGRGYIITFTFNEEKRFCLRKLGISENVLKIPDELLRSDIDMNITGSCHSLLCFTGKQYQELFPCNTYLWNPSIRAVKKLPDPNSLPPEFDICKGSSYLCGIGFDSRTNDYKVVQIIHGRRTSLSCCQVYSLSTNSWRWIESYPCIYLGQGYYKQSCTWCKGCLYWIARAFILSFNLSDEIFEIISLPSDDILNGQGIVMAANVGLIKESLALFVECLNENTSVWVLKKELSEGGEIGSSWSKLCSVQKWSINQWIYCCPGNVGLCGELLLQRFQRVKGRSRYYLGVWDFREHKFRKLGIEIRGFASDVYTYSESLVLLNQLGS